ncbi:MAG: GNAT family N-acetyltransferase [Bacteroidales bacterium]|nr:MAG: GNAT family N-acetyltransferase [Bacteroidales bacterium]
MHTVIRPYDSEDFSTITNLFPPEWNFDFGEFIALFHKSGFFRGYTLQVKDNPAGFGNLFVFGPVCWIGNIVVSREYRNRGLGTMITRFLIKKGESMGAETFNLVATEQGEYIYRKLGFTTELKYGFYSRRGNMPETNVSGFIRDATIRDLKGISDITLEITSENREEMIRMFLHETKLVFSKSEELKGFYIRRPGNGLIVSSEPGFGTELLKYKIESGDQMVVIPENNIHAKDFLIRNGFEKNMELPRMTKGAKCIWKPECIFSRGTGYFG